MECGLEIGREPRSEPAETASIASGSSSGADLAGGKKKPAPNNPVVLFIAWAGVAAFASPVIILLFWMLSGWFGGDDEEEAPPAAQEVAAEVDERPSDLSAMDCLVIEGHISAVEYTFSQGEANPQEIVLILGTTATDFEGISSTYVGSERDWLLKMSELSDSLSEYVLSGTGNGDLIFDQLINNYGLVEQFCG